MIFCDLLEKDRPPLLPLFSRQLAQTKQLYGERFATVFMRKIAAFWLKGKKGAAEYKRKLFSAESSESVLLLAEEIFR